MTCDDVELELSGGEPSPEARAHLADCASCRETARVLGLATLPPLTDTERVALQGLAPSTRAAWREAQGRTAIVRRAGSLLLAAGLGALLASAVLVKTTPASTPVEPRVQTVFVTPPEISLPELEEPNLSDDDVFFDVGWPSPTEGDL